MSLQNRIERLEQRAAIGDVDGWVLVIVCEDPACTIPKPTSAEVDAEVSRRRLAGDRVNVLGWRNGTWRP